jgi:hypothetical protein
MDEPRTVPAVSSAEREQFSAEDLPAYSAETDGKPCCQGVDVPGVGNVHSFDCPNHCSPHFKQTSSFIMPVAGEVPAALGHLLRDDLLGWLMFAARNLAAANIIKDHRDDGGHIVGQPLSCRECHFGATSDGLLHHAKSCDTGHVFALIDELTATVTEFKEQEAAPAEEKLRAGDGIRLRGMNDGLCSKCGERGGIWGGEFFVDPLDLTLLELNQIVGPGGGGVGSILYTHHCGDAQAVGQ